MINVGLADDDPLVRNTLAELLATTDDIRVVWTAKDGRQALELLRSPQTDEVQVLLLDVQMPHLDGIALAEILHKEAPEIGVLILTTFVADSILDQALAAGVRGFIAKEDPVSTLADTIRHVVSGNLVLSPASSAIISRMSAPSAPPTAPEPKPVRRVPPSLGVNLSPREMEVLALMVEALSNKQIASRLCVSEATVKSHVSTLIAKLGVQDRVGAVVYALRHGLV